MKANGIKRDCCGAYSGIWREMEGVAVSCFIRIDFAHPIYIIYMESEDISWGEGKDEILRLKFGFGFQRIVNAIENDDVLDIRDHPNLIDYGHQKQMIVKIDGCGWVVPYILDTNGIFLKTMFPSRTETKRYIGGKQ